MNERAKILLERQQRVWLDLQVLLAAAGIEVCGIGALSEDERRWLDGWFMERVFPVLTPAGDRPGPSLPVHPEYGPGDGPAIAP